MKLEDAIRISRSATDIGLFLEGITGKVQKESIRDIAALSLAQLQTAVDVVQAENRNSRQGVLRVTCADGLLERVKEMADAFVNRM